MPITCRQPLRPLTRENFSRLAYELMRDVFEIRNELGRFFDERLYKRALAHRRQDVMLEVPVYVSYQTFQKTYFLDALFAHGAIIEFKATDALSPRHKAQLINYQMLTGLEHGLLINLRPEQVVKEFVNCPFTQQGKFNFRIVKEEWNDTLPGASEFSGILTQLLRDWGHTLELTLYEEALTHFLGGEEVVSRNIAVHFDDIILGRQPMRLAAERTAFRLTAFDSPTSQERFIHHMHLLIKHTDIDRVWWANLAHHEITFRNLQL